jgi:hypothetical protein
MFEVCKSLNEAYLYLLTTREKQRLWTILTFAAGDERVDVEREGRYYVFTSVASLGGQMFNLARDALTELGYYGPGIDGGRELAHSVKEGFEQRALRSGDFDREGHAEEHMIVEIARILRQEREIRNALPPRGIILNSDTPCTVHDAKPSSSLAGWPRSCTAKLFRLAQENPAIQWSVFYMRRFGALNEKGMTVAKVGRAFQTAKGPRQGRPGNIDIYPYTADMLTQARKFDLV